MASKILMEVLKLKNFERAEKLIRNSHNPRCLNGDPNEEVPVPLIIVLSGEVGCYNLYLAKLLVEQGADVNVDTEFDIPLNKVFEIYLEVKAQCEVQTQLFSSDTTESKISYPVIGLNGEGHLPPSVLLNHVLELIDIFIAHGARTSTELFFRVMEINDIGLVKKLFEAGGDFRMEDVHGSTPLMVHIAVAKRDAALPLFQWIISTEPNLDLNHGNCCNETMIWHAMLAGSPVMALTLIRYGADPTKQVAIRNITQSVSTNLSAIFAPLLGVSAPYLQLHACSLDNEYFSVNDLNAVMRHTVFPVVDAADFLLDSSIISELESLLLKTKFPMDLFTNRGLHPQDVGALILSDLKCGLQQLCIRKVMQHLIVRKRGLKNVIHNVENLYSDTDSVIWKAAGKDLNQWCLIQKLNPCIVGVLVKDILKLPSGVVPQFLAEAARIQVGASLFPAEPEECKSGCLRNEESPVFELFYDD